MKYILAGNRKEFLNFCQEELGIEFKVNEYIRDVDIPAIYIHSVEVFIGRRFTVNDEFIQYGTFAKRVDCIQIVEFIRKKITLDLQMKEVKTFMGKERSEISGLSFVFTGTLAQMTRPQAQARIEKYGGVFSNSLNRYTNFLVTGIRTGSKLTKAEQLGVKILTEQDFLKLLVRLGETDLVTVAGEDLPQILATPLKNDGWTDDYREIPREETQRFNEGMKKLIDRANERRASPRAKPKPKKDHVDESAIPDAPSRVIDIDP